MKNNLLFTSAISMITLLIPFASGLIDIRILFAVLLLLVLVARHFLGRQEITEQCIDTVFYEGAMLLAFYVVDTAIAHGLFPFFDRLSDKVSFSNMLALWVILIVVLRYVDSTDKRQDISYITAGIIAELTLAVNGEWGAQFFMLMLIIGVAVKMEPLAERMKRVMQLFFGASFILCNMSLLFNYVDWFKVENVSYSLEVSVVGELALSILALGVLQEWDRIPKDVDMSRVRLLRLQRRTKKAAIMAMTAIALIGVVGYDMGIGSNGTKISFLNESGEAARTGILTNTAVALLYHVHGAFRMAFSENLLGTGGALWGILGIGAGILFIGIVGWLMYRGFKEGFEGREIFAVIAFFEMAQLLLLPTAWELLPMYILFLYGAVGEYIPKKVPKIKIRLFKKKEEVEVKE